MKSASRLLVILLASIVATNQSGCTSIMWDEATNPSTESTLVGKVPTPDGGAEIIYEIREMPERPDGLYSFRIPSDWASKPKRPLESNGNLFTLEPDDLVLLKTFTPPDPTWRDRIENMTVLSHQGLGLVDTDAAVEPGSELTSYQIVQSVTPDDRVVHELFGFGAESGAWVKLGSANLGPSGDWVVGALFLTPVTLAVDVVWVFLFLFSVLG